MRDPATEGIMAARADDELREIHSKHSGDMTDDDLRAVVWADLDVQSKDDVISLYVTSMTSEELEAVRNRLADEEVAQRSVINCHYDENPQDVIAMANDVLMAAGIDSSFRKIRRIGEDGLSYKLVKNNLECGE